MYQIVLKALAQQRAPDKRAAPRLPEPHLEDELPELQSQILRNCLKGYFGFYAFDEPAKHP